jgi:hypothetical protein
VSYHIDGGKPSIAISNAQELHVEFAPESAPSNPNVDPFAAHFGHYFAYLDRPSSANFDVVPQKVAETKTATPKVGNSFAAFFPYYSCFLVEI